MQLTWVVHLCIEGMLDGSGRMQQLSLWCTLTWHLPCRGHLDACMTYICQLQDTGLLERHDPGSGTSMQQHQVYQLWAHLCLQPGRRAEGCTSLSEQLFDRALDLSDAQIMQEAD